VQQALEIAVPAALLGSFFELIAKTIGTVAVSIQGMLPSITPKLVLFTRGVCWRSGGV